MTCSTPPSTEHAGARRGALNPVIQVGFVLPQAGSLTLGHDAGKTPGPPVCNKTALAVSWKAALAPALNNPNKSHRWIREGGCVWTWGGAVGMGGGQGWKALCNAHRPG